VNYLKKNLHPNLLLLLASLLLFASCSTTKRVKDNQHLLIKNEAKVLNPTKEFNNSDLESLITQKPNKKLFGFLPVGLWINSWFKNAGHDPVILDRGMIAESKSQMQQYLNNCGFYNSLIEHDIKFRKKKAKRVSYLVTLAEPYHIRNYLFKIPDSNIYRIVTRDLDNSYIKSKNIFNTFTLNAERTRIGDKLNNEGYFGFSRDYIFYEADSSLLSREVDLTLNIRNFISIDPESGNPNPPTDHTVYYIGNVTVNPDFIPFSDDTSQLKTLEVETNIKNPNTTDLFKLTYADPLKIKPKLISRSLFVAPHSKYNETDAAQTYKKLNQHRIFKYVDVKFKPGQNVQDSVPGRNYLDCHINLTRNPVHSYSIEAQGTNSGGDLGLAGYLVYTNKNIFRGGEVFNVRFKGALEAQESSITPENGETRLYFFNTFEAGVEASLYIPKFLAPVSEELFSKYFRPKTTINLGYNVQNRIEYDRIITNASFGYEWSENRFKKHIFYPADVNVVSVNTTPEFDSTLAGESQRFRNLYTDHLIVGLKYSYIFNNQEINRIKNFFYFRGNFESSGNLLNTIVARTNTQENVEGYKSVFGIRYSQYAKADVDLRYYIMVEKKHSIAFRTFVGTAIPYGNSIDIPFEKGYYGGGANGMRAWPLRYLGPGTYRKPDNKVDDIERVGDVMLEANFEYRFPVYNFLTGAVFYDIGNIWLLSENETYPGGKFEFKDFYNELAMDVGLGVRLDFSYFIFRVDFAQKLKDPSRTEKDRWVIGADKGWFKPVVNLGIGYPF